MMQYRKVILFIIILSSLLVVHNGNAFAEEKATDVYLGNEDYVLEGLIDKMNFYYEIPVEEIEGNNYFYVHVRYSDLLLKDSTVTIAVDGEPVKSVHIDPEKTEMEIGVPLKGDMLKRGFHQVSVSFYGELAADMCTNEENPANWMTILSDSHVHLLLDSSVKEHDDMLGDYPYPFVHPYGKSSPQSTIVIPDDASSNTIAAATNIASYLMNQAVEEDVVDIITEADFSKRADKLDTHIIVVGPITDFHGVADGLIQTADLDVKANHLLINHEIVTLGSGEKQAMFVLAEEDEQLKELVPILTTDDYVDQLSGNQIQLKQLPKQANEEKQDHITLEDLSIPDITLNGMESKSEFYFYHLPTYVDMTENAYVHLKLKISETLLYESEYAHMMSELVIFVNGVPHSISIRDLEQDNDGFYRVALPISPETLQEERVLSIQFVGNGLEERDICVPPSDEKWIFVDDDSYIEFVLTESGAQSTDFSNWPQPFMSSDASANTLLVLTEKVDEEMLAQLQEIVHQITPKNNAATVEIIQSDDVTEAQLAEHDVIFIGDIRKWDMLAEHESLLLELDDDNVLSIYEHGFVAEIAKNVGFMQPSIWNEDSTLAIFTTAHADADTKDFLSKHLMEKLHDEKLHANIIVETTNGDVFSNELAKDDPKGNMAKKQMKTADEPWMLYLFIGIFIVSLVIFVLVIRRMRKKKDTHDL